MGFGDRDEKDFIQNYIKKFLRKIIFDQSPFQS